ncbi:ATP-binding protein [Siccirubricoccus sp. KC 17139]|uniref:histidine kinase n=1 Tax=Siccirubricoccus soli TaxID=2899147 RepID=A0ABT1D3M3_9PROT|nr:ATP-binding protein [Siccirubricoccus soli]MCO6416525.1 ATP-binding protein [Siccirubricoccus soli]MCP2682659.1 ATP-binding protein [Siccirubricoccus soli]
MAEKRLTAIDRSILPAAGQELADLVSDSVIVCDLQGVIRYWNAASETLYGWPAMAAVGRGIAEFSPSSSLEAEHWRRLLREGHWHGPIRRRTSKGSQVTALVRRVVRHDHAAQPVEIVEYGRSGAIGIAGADVGTLAHLHASGAACWELDTSGASAAVAALAISGHRSAAFDDLLATTRIVDVNQRAVRLFGGNASREHMIGQPLASFWPRESGCDLARILLELAARRPPEIVEKRLPEATGLLRDAALTAWRPVGRGRTDTVFLMIHGATGDDRTAWELQASEERYRKLIHNMPTALWQIDARATGEIFDRLKGEGLTDIEAFLDQHPELIELGKDIIRITDVNHKAVSLFQSRNAAELLGPVRYLFAATPEAAKRVMVAHFEGRRNYTEQARILTFGGELRDVLICVTFPMPPEQLDTTFLTIEDITERLRIEAQLRQHQADHAQAARISTLAELATSIAHEVKQPLSAIVTNAETSLRWLSREPVNTEKLRQLTGRIISSARRASDIIQHVRSMAQSGEWERVALDLRDVVEEALLFVHHDIESKHIELTIAADPARPKILGNRVQLQQVIVNLVVNGIQALCDARSAERRIQICLDADVGNALRFFIRDSGPGIALQDLERVFESFFTTKIEGMGIGLAVCHSIISAHGGRIEASNHPGGGACFRFWLPGAPSCRPPA